MLNEVGTTGVAELMGVAEPMGVAELITGEATADKLAGVRERQNKYF